MKIKIFPNTDNKVQRPNFKKLDTFTEIKQIPDMICACCGRKVLSIDKYVASITPLSKPLEYVMQRGRLNYLKNLLPESWNLLKHFIIKYPKTSLDEIVAKKADFTALKITIADAMDDSSIPLNTPESTVLDTEISRTFFKILENGRSFMKEATLVLESLSPYKSILSGYEKEVFEILEEYAKKYPDKTLSQIIQETHDIHDTRAALFKEKISNSINERLENIKQIVKDYPEIVKNFEDVEKEVIDIIYQDFSVTTRIFKIKKSIIKFSIKTKELVIFIKF